MKINWGTGLVIGMVAFISFILYFVVTMMSSTAYDHDLVVEDYYKAELHFQQDIDAEKNALSMQEKITLARTGSKLILMFPENMDINRIEGHVNFYRPSNKKLDFSISFKDIDNREFEIPKKILVSGRWNVKVAWMNNDKDFLLKKEIIY